SWAWRENKALARNPHVSRTETWGTHTNVASFLEVICSRWALHVNRNRTNYEPPGDSFLIHAENPSHPGRSSDGCIVADKQSRERIAKCAGGTLNVTS